MIYQQLCFFFIRAWPTCNLNCTYRLSKFVWINESEESECSHRSNWDKTSDHLHCATVWEYSSIAKFLNWSSITWLNFLLDSIFVLYGNSFSKLFFLTFTKRLDMLDNDIFDSFGARRSGQGALITPVFAPIDVVKEVLHSNFWAILFIFEHIDICINEAFKEFVLLSATVLSVKEDRNNSDLARISSMKELQLEIVSKSVNCVLWWWV